MANSKPTYSPQEKQRIFTEDFMPHLDAMYNFAYRLTQNHEDANDLVQDASLKAFRFISSFERGTNAKAWLFRIVKNSFINDFRKKSRQPNKVDYSEMESYYNSEGTDANLTVDLRSETVRNKIGDEVSNAIRNLSVDFRTVIILCDLEGFTYEEMAAILDIPVGTVRSRLHRARGELKKALATYAKEQGYGND